MLKRHFKSLLVADALSFASFHYHVKIADNHFTCFADKVYVMPRDADFVAHEMRYVDVDASAAPAGTGAGAASSAASASGAGAGAAPTFSAIFMAL